MNFDAESTKDDMVPAWCSANVFKPCELREQHAKRIDDFILPPSKMPSENHILNVLRENGTSRTQDERIAAAENAVAICVENIRRYEAMIEEARKALKEERARSLYDRTHHVSEVSKLPSDTRYWALEQTSMTYDSGYGEHGRPDMCTSQFMNVVCFDDEEALQDWVLKAVEQRKTYRIFRAEPVKAVFSIVK